MLIICAHFCLRYTRQWCSIKQVESIDTEELIGYSSLNDSNLHTGFVLIRRLQDDVENTDPNLQNVRLVQCTLMALEHSKDSYKLQDQVALIGLQ